jgi:4-hydroxyproline epimerase
VNAPGIGTVHGDIVWGGNWFFMIDEHGQQLEIGNVEALTQYCWTVRHALNANGILGEGGHEIDHIELCSPLTSGANAKNFMLCPGKAYDRSPCGTGTSAKLACLAADGLLAEGERWVQAGILGSTFVGTYKQSGRDGVIVATISGSAVVTGVGELILDTARDPFCWGIRPGESTR